MKFRYPFYYEMCWYVLERYVFSLTKTSYLTPEFQKHSLGIGMYTALPSRSHSPLGHTPMLCGPYWSALSLCLLHEGLKNQCGSDPVSEQLKAEGEGVGSEEDSEKLPLKVHLTPLELEGLWNLLGKLEALPSNKKCVPAGIHNAPALITHIKVSLLCVVVELHVSLAALSVTLMSLLSCRRC